ncbi:hypothetical protein AB0D13_14690 [Streptomyces sp. NPDC048430]|uniref:hypothetical protein n=1 Tax=unclassified Streptomyces TaxID=2593676 RepID=UPI003429652E
MKKEWIPQDGFRGKIPRYGEITGRNQSEEIVCRADPAEHDSPTVERMPGAR